MNSLARAIERGRQKVSVKAGKFLPDLLTIYGAGGETRDDYGEVTTPDTAGEARVPCKYGALNAYERAAGGSVAQTATHKIRMPATVKTLAITGSNRLVVAARGKTPELTFDVTGRLDDSTDLLLTVAAILRD